MRYRDHLLRKEADPLYYIPMRAPWGTREAFFGALKEEDWVWLENLPLYIRISDKWVVLHAGLEPGIPLEKQSAEVLLHCRYIKKTTKTMQKHIGDVPARMLQVWPEAWDGPENVIYGHMITPTKMPHIDISAGGALCVGIDTGCCFGHSLTAMILEPEGRSFSFVSVPAIRTYDDDMAAYLAAVTPS